MAVRVRARTYLVFTPSCTITSPSRNWVRLSAHPSLRVWKGVSSAKQSDSFRDLMGGWLLWVVVGGG